MDNKDRKIQNSRDLSSDEKFVEALTDINKKGGIPSHRKGDTGVGKTLEDALGVEENSVQAPDLGEAELKATRSDSKSKVTLFTKSPEKRGVNNTVLREKYGYKTEESLQINPDIKVLHTAINGKNFNTLDGEAFLKLTEKDDKIYIEHAKDGILEEVYWKKETLKKAVEKKFPAGKVYHVKADVEKDSNGSETFRYSEAESLEGFNFDKMMEGLESGDLDVDIRLGVFASGKKKGKAHDNGTAVRIASEKMGNIFEKKRKLT